MMVAATHCFEKSLMMTVIQDNINPIEKLERSSLIVASTIHGAPAEALVCDAQRERVATTLRCCLTQSRSRSRNLVAHENNCT